MIYQQANLIYAVASDPSKFVKRDGRDISGHAGQMEEVVPGQPLLVYGRGPVIQMRPWREHQYPILIILSQAFHEVGGTYVHVSTKVEAFARVDGVQ